MSIEIGFRKAKVLKEEGGRRGLQTAELPRMHTSSQAHCRCLCFALEPTSGSQEVGQGVKCGAAD